MKIEFNDINKWFPRYTKTVTYFHYENEIIISEEYLDGSIVGEFKIIDTPYGFQLQAFYDSWRILKDCSDLMNFLGSRSMAGVTMRELAEQIEKIGYELKVV